jgi:hypothetical protein
MPYTYKSLAVVWLIAFSLLALIASGVVSGPWFVLLLAVGLAAPALLIRSPARATTRPRESPWPAADERAGSLPDAGGVDVYRWENEGGARWVHVSSGPREPAHAP